MDFTGCENLDLSHMKIDQYLSFDLEATAQALTNNDLTNELKNSISATATSLAKAGLFVAGSESKVVEDVTTQLTTAIKNLCSSMASGMSTMIVNIKAPYCKNVNLSFLTIDQRVQMVEKAATASEDFNTVKQSLVQEVSAATSSTASGFDPTTILIIIAAIAGVILLFFLGGTSTAVKMLMSPYTWFLVGSLTAITGGYLTASSVIDTWPSKKDKDNTGVMTAGLIVGTIGLAASIATGFMIFKKGKTNF
jgi:hypothetical protein